MEYIHDQCDWPNLFWNHEELVAPLAAVRYQQGLLLGRMGALGFDLQAEAGLEIFTTNIVKSSEIEGETLDREQVRSSIARRLGLDVGGVSVIDRHIDGIVEMMLDATQHAQDPLTTERLFSWHYALFPQGRSGMRRIEVGAWRSLEAGPMQVVSGPMGREKIHFEAPAAERLDHEMQLFLDWFSGPAQALDPFLKAGVAHFWFITIHPFEDGNGRIARAIADLCLAQADQIAERFYSMSAQIEKERRDYYDQLEQSQKGGLDLTEWLLWFLDCLGRALAGAEAMVEQVLDRARIWNQLKLKSVNLRQQKVLNRFLGEFAGKLTSAKYAKIAKCSQDTALRDINTLIEWGVLEVGPAGGRSTNYQRVVLK